MNDKWSAIGRVLKSAAAQAAILSVYVAVSTTVQNFVNHKFKQYTAKKKTEDNKIEVKPVEPVAAPVPETKVEPQLETKPVDPKTETPVVS